MMTLELHHPTDPRFLFYPVAPDELSDAGIFEARLYGKVLVYAPTEPDAIYDHHDNPGGGVWIKRATAEEE